MHRHGLFFVTSLAFATFAVAGPARADSSGFDLTPLSAPVATPMQYLAPADEEFGQYRLTPLGVANAIAAAGARFTDDSPREELAGGSFALAVDSLRAWEAAYPHDPGVARNLAKIAHAYARLHSDTARDFAARTVAWLERDYPGTRAARTARREIAVAVRDQEPQVDATFATLDNPPPVRAAPESALPPLQPWQHYEAVDNDDGSGNGGR